MRKIPILLVGIILLGILLRVYNFPFRYGLGEETVRDAVIGIQAARDIQLPFTGAFSSLGPFTFGPMYAYQLAFATYILPTNYAPWIYLTLLSIAYIPVMYKIGEKLYGKIYGLLLAFLVAISPTQIISGTHLTSHNVTNIFAAGALLLFIIIIKQKKSTWWNFFLGVTIGIGISLHFQMIGLLFFPLVLLLKQRKVSGFLSSAVGVFITFLPYIFFELNNHWFNTRNIIHFLLYDKQKIAVPNRWLTYLFDFWPKFWGDALGIPSVFAFGIMTVFAVLIAYLFIKKKINKVFLIIILSFILNFVLLRYYFGPRFFGYLNYLRPYIFLFTAFPLHYLWSGKKKFGKVLVIMMLILLVFFPIKRIQLESKKDGLTIQMYEINSLIEKQTHNNPYTVYSCPRLDYDGNYNGKLLSMSFIADMKKGYARTPIGIVDQSCDIVAGTKLLGSKYGLRIVDLSSTSSASLEKLGWKQVTFSSIYNGYAKWWVILKP